MVGQGSNTSLHLQCGRTQGVPNAQAQVTRDSHQRIDGDLGCGTDRKDGAVVRKDAGTLAASPSRYARVAPATALSFSYD